MLALALCAGPAFAQLPTDVLKVDYFSNANTAGAPDGTYRLTNPGTSGGNIYAAIYVFDPNQELTECCACFLSPDGLRTLSVNTDLTSNPLTGVTLSTGVVKMVSGAVVTGSAAAAAKTNHTALFATKNVTLAITPAIRSWGTHIQNSNFSETETASQDATLSATEVFRLNAECEAIFLDGSGHGICSCGTGD